MKKPTIVLNLRSYSYNSLYLFAQGIHDGVAKMPALLPSPVPTLAVFQNSINAVRDNLENWGERGRLGGSREKAKMLQSCDVLRENLKSYANYVMITQPGNAKVWTDVGFVLKKYPAKTGTMEAVQNFHQFFARNIAKGKIKLKWERPLGAPDATIITYKVFRSADELFANAVLIGTTVNKATYIDTPGKAGVLFYYWVMPVTTAGDGVLSEMCTAFASPV